jgi:hypothetical protein
MIRPAKIAVIRPLAASRPELTPNARASGRATAVTVRPASRSLENEAAEYEENSPFKSEINVACFGLSALRIPPTPTYVHMNAGQA